MLLGFISLPQITPPNLFTNPKLIPKQQTLYPIIKTHNLSCNKKALKRFKLSFSEENKQQLTEENEKQDNDDDDVKKKKKEQNGEDERPRFNLKWSELLFDPDPNNVVAVGLTGVLAWASVQVLWQLFVISFAILIAAVKYSLIAALLIFILITLL
uniref:uncharacterized protein LOC122585391 n=1 Tax=Erigeron canadensis TaxID=72917 RepID=UPI001CB9821E|nr:uncharacterized protein LOC122585391 [Erigeron canadensis]